MLKIKLTASNGAVFDALWALQTADDTLFAKIADSRPISQIASDLDGQKWIKRIAPDGEEVLFNGFSVLYGIERESNDMVRVTIKKAV